MNSSILTKTGFAIIMALILLPLVSDFIFGSISQNEDYKYIGPGAYSILYDNLIKAAVPVIIFITSILVVFNIVNRYDLSVGSLQSIIALLVVVSFCVMLLAGSEQVGVMKDIVLVVVGFYFGSQINSDQNKPVIKSRTKLDNSRTDEVESG